METTEGTVVSDSTSQRADSHGLSSFAYDRAQALTQYLAVHTEATLRTHFDACVDHEARMFGRASDYRLEVEALGQNMGGFEVIRILTGASPIPEVVEHYGRQRKHLGRPVQTRFWMRIFELAIDADIDGAIRFSRQNEHGWQIVSETNVDSGPDGFADWLSKQLSVVSRHASGRSIAQGGQR